MESNFKILKQSLYPNVWRFGFGIIDYGKDSLHYTLYPIKSDENDAQIRDIEQTPAEFHDLNRFIISGHTMENPLEYSPKQLAYNSIESRISTLFEENRLNYSGCDFSATEYIYDFTQQFAPLLGLERKETYNVSNIKEGYYRHLQFWLSEEIRDILRQHNIGEVHIQLDGHLNSETSQRQERAFEVAEAKTSKINEDPPRHWIAMRNFDQTLVEHLIDVLAESTTRQISKPYQYRDRENPDTNRIADLYSDEAIFQNVSTYYKNYHREYRQLVRNNFPDPYEELSDDCTNFLVLVLNRDNLRGRAGISSRRFWLDSDEESLRVECFWESEFNAPDELYPSLGDTLSIDNTEYKIVRAGHGGPTIISDIDRTNRVVFNKVTSELKRSVESYLRGKRVSFTTK